MKTPTNKQAIESADRVADGPAFLCIYYPPVAGQEPTARNASTKQEAKVWQREASKNGVKVECVPLRVAIAAPDLLDSLILARETLIRLIAEGVTDTADEIALASINRTIAKATNNQ